MQADNCALKREMEANSEKHKQDLLNNSQLQELATMLQEGHRYVQVYSAIRNIHTTELTEKPGNSLAAGDLIMSLSWSFAKWIS